MSPANIRDSMCQAHKLLDSVAFVSVPGDADEIKAMLVAAIVAWDFLIDVGAQVVAREEGRWWAQ